MELVVLLVTCEATKSVHSSKKRKRKWIIRSEAGNHSTNHRYRFFRLHFPFPPSITFLQPLHCLCTYVLKSIVVSSWLPNFRLGKYFTKMSTILFLFQVAFTEEQEAELSRAAQLDAKELIKVEGTKMKLSKELMSQ